MFFPNTSGGLSWPRYLHRGPVLSVFVAFSLCVRVPPSARVTTARLCRASWDEMSISCCSFTLILFTTHPSPFPSSSSSSPSMTFHPWRLLLFLHLLPSSGSCLEILRGESPALGEAGSDSASPMSPRTSKSRMSMKLRRSSGSANKTWVSSVFINRLKKNRFCKAKKKVIGCIIRTI